MFDWLEKEPEKFVPNYMEEKEYRAISAISGTDVRIYCTKGSKYFDLYKKGEIEVEETQALILGTAIHCAVLEPEKFLENYSVYNGPKPNSEQKKKFAKAMSEGVHYVEAYSQFYVTSKKTDAAIEKAANELYQELVGYIDHLALNGDKINLDNETYTTVLNCKTNVLKHLNFYLYGEAVDKPLGKDVYVEGALFSNYGGLTLKGKIDLLVINYEKKEVIIFDLKTTTASLSSLKGDMMRKRYDLQLDFYKYLVRNQEQFNDFSVATKLITVQTNEANSTAIIDIYTENNISGILNEIIDKKNGNDFEDYPLLTWDGGFLPL